VDINSTLGQRGRVSLETTNVYAEIDPQMKASALAKCEVIRAAGPADDGISRI
jgi:hypothetical protein